MPMSLALRRFAFTAHVAFSVGWLGAVTAYLALPITGLSGNDPQTVRSVYIAMELIGWYAIVPLAVAALVSGLVQSLGTEWGLVRHYWILVKLALTVLATLVLLGHMPRVTEMAQIAAGSTIGTEDYRDLRLQLLVHAALGLGVLLATTVISIYKPWGRTPWGEKRRTTRLAGTGGGTTNNSRERAMEENRSGGSESSDGSRRDIAERSRPWTQYLLYGLIGLIVAFVIVHLAGGGMRH